jgi:hypothetical protein
MSLKGLIWIAFGTLRPHPRLQAAFCDAIRNTVTPERHSILSRPITNNFAWLMVAAASGRRSASIWNFRWSGR